MTADFGLPMQLNGDDREEILIVYFDGFIKNITECMIRTMCENIDIWKDKYHNLDTYRDLTADDLYHETMLFRPLELLNLLSDNSLSDEELMTDLEEIASNIDFSKSVLTTFEFALYTILHESNVKKCYIFKDTEFYENEIEYVKKQYKDVMTKIEFVSGGLLTLYDEVKPTTIFVNNPILPMDVFPSNYDDDDLVEKIFILLNSSANIEYNEKSDLFYYTTEFEESMKRINDERSYGLFAMFNFPLIDESKNKEQDDDEEEVG